MRVVGLPFGLRVDPVFLAIVTFQIGFGPVLVGIAELGGDPQKLKEELYGGVFRFDGDSSFPVYPAGFNHPKIHRRPVPHTH